MTDNLEALIPGGGMVATAIGLLGWFVRNSKDERNEWKDVLKEEREQHAKDLGEADKVEMHLRSRLSDAETAIAGYKDRAADAERDLRICQAELASERSAKMWLQTQLSMGAGSGQGVRPPPPHSGAPS